MGSDPALAGTPIVVPAGPIICLIALTSTAGPVLAGAPVTPRRRRLALWGSGACLAGVVLWPFAEPAPGRYGFRPLMAVAVVAGAILLRSRPRPA